MSFNSKLSLAQELINKYQLDGWLLYDFRRSNSLACDFLELIGNKLLTRRFFYWIPKEGEPSKIVQSIESSALASLPGKELSYRTWKDLEQQLAIILNKSKRVAMEYSPRNAIPYLSKVDGGTLELVRSFGVQVESSANILLYFTSIWDEKKFKLHLEAAQALDQIAEQTWIFIKNALRQAHPITEYSVQQFILDQITARGFETSDAPICAVNEHSADPHYMPDKNRCSPIRKNDFILIDLWCKKKQAEAVYADITRVAVASSQPTTKQEKIFSIVYEAQKTATDFIKNKFKNKDNIKGWEVDQVCRNCIQQAGYGDYFIHRTGHNIDQTDHGNGTNIDNFETHDDRLLLPQTCFSIEPGIYLPGEFGIRLEYDVFIHSNSEIEITGGVQDRIKTLD